MPWFGPESVLGRYLEPRWDDELGGGNNNRRCVPLLLNIYVYSCHCLEFWLEQKCFTYLKVSARPFPTLQIIVSRCVSVLVTRNCVYAVKIVHHSLRVCVIRVSAWTSISYPLIWTLQWKLWHDAWCHNTIACCYDELSRVSLREQWGISRDTQWHACMDSILLSFQLLALACISLSLKLLRYVRLAITSYKAWLNILLPHFDDWAQYCCCLLIALIYPAFIRTYRIRALPFYAPAKEPQS